MTSSDSDKLLAWIDRAALMNSRQYLYPVRRRHDARPPLIVLAHQTKQENGSSAKLRRWMFP